MTFLNQALLFGLIAVSIPIIIHLLNRRRFQKVPWAAMRFLRVSVEQNQRRMKLEDWILLAVRCLLIALLVFAIARPVVEGLRGVPGSTVGAVILVDNSASMGTADGGGSRLDRARTVAQTIVDGLPGESRVAIATPFRPGDVTTDRAVARRNLAEVWQTDRHGDLLKALEEAVVMLEIQAAVEKEIYLITDGHAAEWSEFAALDAKLQELSVGRNVQVVLVGSAVDENLGISRVVPSNSLPTVGRPLRFEVEVTNFGERTAVDVPVAVRVDGQKSGEPWIIDELRPGRSENATVYATMPASGDQRITFELEADAVPFDDRRTLVVRAVDEVRVLLVDGDPGAEPRESETFFLKHALAPVREDERASHPVKPTVVSGSELEGANLADYHAVMLANVSAVPLAVADRLSEYVESGGGLVVFGGENLQREVYNTLFHTKHGLLPVSLGPLQEVELRRAQGLVPDDTNPLGFDREMLSAASIHKYYEVRQAGPARSSGNVVLRYASGEPALVESEFGRGKVYLFSSTVDLAWGDLAIKPVFVSFVNRLLGGILAQSGASLNLQAGEVLRYRVAPEFADREATIYEVGDPKALGRLTTVVSSGGHPVLQFAGTDRGGAYQATFEDQASVVQFAVQPSGRESSLALLESEQLERIADSAALIRWPADAGEFRGGSRGSELWLVLLLAVIALLVAELVLAQWFSRAK